MIKIIKVTQEHINKGKKRNILFCPIALALNDAFGTECSVGPKDWGFRGESLCYFLSQKCKDFIKKFDNSKPVEPFEFEVYYENSLQK